MLRRLKCWPASELMSSAPTMPGKRSTCIPCSLKFAHGVIRLAHSRSTCRTTAVMLAAKGGHAAAVAVLAGLGADVMCTDNAGCVSHGLGARYAKRKWHPSRWVSVQLDTQTWTSLYVSHVLLGRLHVSQYPCQRWARTGRMHMMLLRSTSSNRSYYVDWRCGVLPHNAACAQAYVGLFAGGRPTTRATCAPGR
jgi:hypothetical protein